ncbi:hypothetical protein QP173_08905, partial [Aerococcus urinae]|uniref:hypothetical protein n=1 Tax=Aerococcus urinae TaxID=1376 RepID=UPI00254BE52C
QSAIRSSANFSISFIAFSSGLIFTTSFNIRKSHPKVTYFVMGGNLEGGNLTKFPNIIIAPTILSFYLLL